MSTVSPTLPAWKVWLLAARPKTLPAAFAPVAIGTAMAYGDGGFHALAALCALLGALMIQVGTNFSNDYSDFLKGADTADRKGPLRATQAGLVTPGAMRVATGVAFGLAVLAGIYLIFRGGFVVLGIGVASIICGILYTVGRYSLAYLGLGDLFVLIFFGPVAVAGTYYVQALTVTLEVLTAGLGAGLLSVAILLANNVRDVEEDRVAAKRTLVVRWGRDFGVGLYAFCLAGAAAVALIVAFGEGRSFVAMAALVPLLGVRNVSLLRKERDASALNPMLGATARILLIYALVFSVGYVAGGVG